MVPEHLKEAFRQLVILNIPPADVLIEVDDRTVRVSKLIALLKDEQELLPPRLAALLGLEVGSSYSHGVAVYLTHAPKPRVRLHRIGCPAELHRLGRRPRLNPAAALPD